MSAHSRRREGWKLRTGSGACDNKSAFALSLSSKKRPWQSHLANNAMLNPRDFGAVFDGVKDDAPAWLACISKARSASSQTSIYFPAGASLIKQTLNVSGIG